MIVFINNYLNLNNTINYLNLNNTILYHFSPNLLHQLNSVTDVENLCPGIKKK